MTARSASTNSYSRTYASWASMKSRCDNENAPNYRDYGGRGISYDPEWASYDAFLRDMGPRPSGRSLDRIDNDKGYSKDNCRWATRLQQRMNCRAPSNNTSGVEGVIWEKCRKRWRAQAAFNGKRCYLYSGPSKDLAIAARKKWEAETLPRLLADLQPPAPRLADVAPSDAVSLPTSAVEAGAVTGAGR